MSRRHVPAAIALFFLVCLVVAASVESPGRVDALLGVSAVYALLVAAVWYASRQRETHRAAAPAVAPASRAAPQASGMPVVRSWYDPGIGLYYLRNTGQVDAKRVFVIGLEADDHVTTMELGALGTGEARVLPQQRLARRDHIVVAEAESPGAPQWTPIFCHRPTAGYYVRASAVPGIAPLGGTISWAVFRDRYLAIAERQLLAGR